MTEKKNTVFPIPEPGKAELRQRPYPKIKPGYSMVRVEIAPICIEHQVYKEHRMEWCPDAYNQGHEGIGTVCGVAPGSRFNEGDRAIIYRDNPRRERFACRRQLSPTNCMVIPYEFFATADSQGPRDEMAALESLGISNPMDVPGGPKSIENDRGSESGGFGFSRCRIAPDHVLKKYRMIFPSAMLRRRTARWVAPTPASKKWALARATGSSWPGGGFIGFGSIINAKYRGAWVIVLDRNDFRMAQTRKIGADHAVNPDDDDWLEQIHALAGGLKGADYVIEAPGYPYYQKKALAAVCRFGTLWLYGFLVGETEPLPIRLPDEIQNRSIGISGSHDVHVKYRKGLPCMLQTPEIPAMSEGMITHEYNMSEAAEAFEAALSKKAGKIFLYPQDNCPRSGMSDRLRHLIEGSQG